MCRYMLETAFYVVAIYDFSQINVIHVIFEFKELRK